MSKTQTASGVAPWPKVRLGDVCEIIGGGTPSIHEKAYYDGGIPWATVRDMGCRVIKKTERTISRLGLENSATNIIKGGELIISTHVGLGKVCYLAQDTAINQDLKGVIPTTKELSRDYLYWWFVSIADYLVSKGTGATVKGVKLDFVKQLQLLLPPLAEQKKIVEKVEKALKRVDALKAQFERMEKSAADYFKAALAETFAAVKGEKVKLGDVCETISVGIVIRPTRYYTANGIKAFRNTNIRACEVRDEDWVQVTDAAIKENPRCEVKMGDVVIARSGLPGVAAAITSAYDGFAAVDILIAKPIANRADSHYLAYAINTSGAQQQIKKMNNGVAQAHIGVNSVSSLLLTLPKMDSQKAIVATLDAAKAKSERMVAAARRSIGICGKMRKAILAEAFQ